MVQTALRAPAGEGRFQLRREQAEVTQRGVLQQVTGVGIHVAHQHLVFIAADQLADISQLHAAGASAQRQVHHDHHQRLRTFAKAHQNRPATLGPR